MINTWWEYCYSVYDIRNCMSCKDGCNLLLAIFSYCHFIILTTNTLLNFHDKTLLDFGTLSCKYFTYCQTYASLFKGGFGLVVFAVVFVLWHPRNDYGWWQFRFLVRINSFMSIGYFICCGVSSAINCCVGWEHAMQWLLS